LSNPLNRHIPGFLATCGIDKTVSLWDTQNSSVSNINPTLVTQKEMKVGKLFTVSFYPSSPWLLGCGGSEKLLSLWNLESEMNLQTHFAPRLSDLKPNIPTEEPVPGNTQDFEDMMSAPSNNEKIEKGAGKKKKEKNKGKKKKAHRRTRFE